MFRSYIKPGSKLISKQTLLTPCLKRPLSYFGKYQNQESGYSGSYWKYMAPLMITTFAGGLSYANMKDKLSDTTECYAEGENLKPDILESRGNLLSYPANDPIEDSFD